MHIISSERPKSKSGKLTKTFLMAAPAGSYLVSNTGWPPIFEESVTKYPSERSAQWKRIVAARANGRHCYLYASKDQSDEDKVWKELAFKAARRFN